MLKMCFGAEHGYKFPKGTVFMKNHVYKLFLGCFPEFPLPQQVFDKLLDIDGCSIVPHYEGDVLAGCGAVKDNNIRLICVSPDFRGRGIGHKLMEECERLIAENGFDKAFLGGADSELFIGAVTPVEQWKEMRNSFFENEGYSARNGCLEMRMKLSDFDFDSLDIPLCPSDTEFGYISEADRDELLAAVEKVDENWVKYFTFESPIFAAKRDGKLVGFCIVDVNSDTIISNGSNNVGVIGCVGVVPESRRNGIGLAMVAHAMQDIKQKGCDDAFIHFTYLDWWYGRLGFKPFLYYWFGKKELK